MLVVCLLMLAVTTTARSATRLSRQVSDIPGMPAGLNAVGQDSTGYIWLASGEGLHRYDGFEVRAWGADITRDSLFYVATGPGDRVAAGSRSAGLFEVAGPTLIRTAPPQGAQAAGPWHAVYDNKGNLWASWDGRLVVRTDGTWRDITPDQLAEDPIYRLAPRERGGVLVGTTHGEIWTAASNGAVDRIAAGLDGRITQLVDDPEGPVAIVRFGARPGVIRLRGGSRVEYLHQDRYRSTGLAIVGDAVWASYTPGIWVLHADGTKELLSEAEGFTGAGSITKDREGGLWITSVRGLSYYPEPSTLIWTPLSGMPHASLRSVHPAGAGYFVASWRGAMLFDATKRQWSELAGDKLAYDTGCHDPWGGVWYKTVLRTPDAGDSLDFRYHRQHFLTQFRDGRVQEHGTMEPWRGSIFCHATSDGRFWIQFGRHVYRLDGAGRSPVLHASTPLNARIPRGIVSTAGTLWIGMDDGTVCSLEGSAPAAPLDEDAWTCEPSGVGGMQDLTVTASGKLWAAGTARGVYERSETGWERLEGDLQEVDSVIGLVESSRGGIWVVGWRERWRVVEGDPVPLVVERIGVEHGVPSWQNGFELLEEPDGTLWLALFESLVRVPPRVREAPPRVPTVTLTSLTADGIPASTDEPLVLRADDPRLELRWSALSFRDPASVRYRMRLDGGEWSELSQPFVRLAGLSGGRHILELGASLDGRTWSTTPATIEFEVQRVWYLRPLPLALMTVAVLALAYLAYRIRLMQALRIERERTRIAMDLHDEMGAGLGSAGLLVGLLSDGKIDPGERERIGDKSAQLLRDLGSSLSDIVWSLRPGTETLDALLLFLRQRAAELFPPGGGARVSIEAPDPCPAIALRLSVRRNLQWIAVEALHNAARHANATRVFVTLEPDGDRWRLCVRDDGQGLPAGQQAEPRAGLGQESMQRRADEIGATLEIRSAPGEGTEICVRFAPSARPSWFTRR